MTLTEFDKIFQKIVDKYSSIYARNSNNSRRSPFQPRLVDITVSADTGEITRVIFKNVYLEQFLSDDNNIVFNTKPNITLEEQINNFFEVLENDPTT